ncbi:AGAP004730-PA-like protein [Anopheles sinensis]|uniref:AGAP004730-PA-like protein n=1 Tax=Anopheles sinensis TaxID=74873 RepID=A0A084VZU9_ANOSI|nr:AGAP004730-PA-like protein [Anopheles sinensis]
MPTLVDGDDDRDSTQALYNILNDEGYRLTLAAILEDYLRINSTNDLVAWSNPAFADYDQKLIIALQSQLEEDDDTYKNDPLADPVSLLPVYGGLKFVTYYCGPGNWSVDGSTVQNSYFSSLDQCCKQHDECPDTIVDRTDYRRYENLPHKPQLFTR